MRFQPKSKSTNYPDHGHHGDPLPTRKIPMVEPGIEPGTSCLVVRNSDHQTTRLVSKKYEYEECFLWGKGGRCFGLTNLPPSCADFLEMWETQPPGTVRTCKGLYRDVLHFTLYTLHFTLCTLHFALCTSHFTLYTLHFTLYTLHFTLWTLHFALYTLHFTLYTLHFALYTLHFTLYTLYYKL
jgi:hypothetical protein